MPHTSRAPRRSPFQPPLPDFQTLFESAPGAFLVLAPDSPRFTILGVTDLYLQVTMTERNNILGRGLFEVFPDNPNDPAPTGEANLGASLNRVLRSKAADRMAVQKYDIRRPIAQGATFEERFWAPTNYPVLDQNGEIRYIIHRVDEVTEFVRERQKHSEQAKKSEELYRRAQELEFEIAMREREAGSVQMAASKHRALLDRRIAFALLAAFIIVNGIVFYRALRKVVDADAWVKHTFEVQREIMSSEAELQHARAEQRALLFSHAPGSLESYERAIAELETDVGQLRSSTADNPHQQARLGTLEHLLQTRKSSFEESLQRLQAGGAGTGIPSSALRQAEEQDAGIADLLQQMHNEESELLARRSAQFNVGLTTAVVALAVSVFAGLVLLVFSWRLSENAVREREAVAMLLERRVSARTAELQKANAELEAFSYSVSHDLRAPLRAIWGFANALEDDYGTGMDETALGYLKSVEDGAKRMDRLITDLLAYSRIGRTPLALRPTDINECCREALAEIRDNVPQATEDWIKIQPDIPQVLGNETLLTQVLANLLSNAIKFVAPGTAAHVRIYAETQNDRVRIFVCDQGIGISEENYERIFKVFERLHGIEDYPGTGIGLAIVKRSVEMMNGSFGVESSVGHGSKFWIELPQAKEAQLAA